MTTKTKATTKTATVANETPKPVTGTASVASLVAVTSAYLDKVEAALGPEAPALTSKEKQRAAKPRKGAAKIIAAIAPIVQQHGLESSSLSATAMMARMNDAQTLQPLQTRLQKVVKRVGDEMFNAEGEAWAMGRQFYSLMQNRGKTDGGVATSLEPVRQMFAYRHGMVKAEKPSKLQTRAKARLKDAVVLATRHDVPVGTVGSGGSAGSGGAVSGAAAVVPVAQPAASAAVGTGAAPSAASVGSAVAAAATPVAAAAVPVATAPAAAVASPGSGAPVVVGH